MSWQNSIELLKFGLPLIPAGLSLTALRLADRYIIGVIAGLEQVAVYDVGYRIGVVVSLVIEPFRAAWQPFAFSIADKPDAPKIYRDVLTYFAAALAFLTLGVTAFRVEFIQIMAPVSYAAATHIVSWVAVSQIFLGVHTVLSMGPMIRNQTRYLAGAGITAGGLNILLNYLLIPPMGILGAAVATFASYLVLAVMTYAITQLSFAIPIDWKRMIKLLLAFGGNGLVILALETFSLSQWTRVTIKILTLLSFPVFLLLTGFITMEQGNELLKMVKGKFFGSVKV